MKTLFVCRFVSLALDMIAALALSPPSRRGRGSIPGPDGPSDWSLHVLPVSARVPSGVLRLPPDGPKTCSSGELTAPGCSWV